MIEGVERMSARDFELEAFVDASVDDLDGHLIAWFAPKQEHLDPVACAMGEFTTRSDNSSHGGSS